MLQLQNLEIKLILLPTMFFLSKDRANTFFLIYPDFKACCIDLNVTF